MEELLAVAGQRASTYSTLTAMRNLRLIRFLDEELDGRVDTYHDKIRETLLAALGSDESRSRHQKLGEAIESRSKEIDDSVIRRIVAGEEIAHPDVERIYDLSFHFHAAAVTEKAGLYAFLAAEQARRQFSPEVAVRQYELAQEEVTSGALRKQLPRFTIGLAEGYCWRGQFAKSAALLEDTSVENFSDHQRAHLLSIACENAFALNQPKKALDLCYEALRVLGVTTPTSPMLNLLLTGRRLTWHLIRLGRSSHGKLEASNIDRLRVKLFEQGLRVSMFRSGTDLFWFLLEGVRAAERFSAMGELAQFYGMYATAASAIGLQSHADRYLNKAIQISEDSGDLYSSGQALQFSGQSHFAQGKYTTAIETLSTANNVFEAVGGSWFNHLVLLHRDQSRFMLGSIHQAAVENWTTFQSSVRQNDMRTNCTAYLQCRVTDGMFPLEKVENRIVRQAEDILSTCNFDKAWGIRHLYKNEYDEAIACFERALERPYKARIPNWHVVVGLLFLTQALRLSAEDLQESNPTEAKKRRRRALKIGRRGSWICRFFPTEYSFALREYGEVLIDLGKYRKAEKYLLKSCAVSKKYDTPYELAKSKLALARLAVKRDESDASNQLASARAEVEKYRDQMKNALAEIEDQF